MKARDGAELIKIIAGEQEPDGSFVSQSVPVGKRFGPGATAYRTTFVPSLIAGALAEVDHPEAAAVRERVADFLVGQHGPQWTYNYWRREAPEATSRPYPDDWDDTSCALVALTKIRPEVVTGEVLGHVVTVLTNTEMAEGGPYRTWVVPADAHGHWQDVDVAVNANIAYMLKLHGVELGSLEALATAAIAEGRVASPYYPGPGALEYFLARWYAGPERGRLLADLVARRDERGRWGGVLETALAVSTAVRLGAAAEVERAAAWLRGLAAGAVRAEGFCMDPAMEGVKYVAGSRALTAALVLEALAVYDRALAAGADRPAARTDGGREEVHQQIVARAKARFEAAGAEIQAGAGHMLERLLGGSAGGQITLLPYLFRAALGERGRDVDDETVVRLGLVSLYGWVAYTIYDDFLDEEGDPRLLSVANVAMRELVLMLTAECDRTAGLAEVAWPVLDRQEAANAWEVTHCRPRRQSELVTMAVPDFGDRRVLAERSMGHALGGLAITLGLGYGPRSPEVRAATAFFYHFLVARQLCDDAHDWKADLQKGQINAVGAHLLEAVDRRGATVRGLYARLDEYLWRQGINEVNGWVMDELAHARAALKAARFVQRPELLEALLEPLEQSVHQAEEQQRQTTEFLRTYRPD